MKALTPILICLMFLGSCKKEANTSFQCIFLTSSNCTIVYDSLAHKITITNKSPQPISFSGLLAIQYVSGISYYESGYIDTLVPYIDSFYSFIPHNGLVRIMPSDSFICFSKPIPPDSYTHSTYHYPDGDTSSYSSYQIKLWAYFYDKEVWNYSIESNICIADSMLVSR